MELCTARAVSKLPHHGLLALNFTRLRWKTSVTLKQQPSIPRTHPGLHYYSNFSVRSSTSEETSSFAKPFVEQEPGMVTVEDVKPVEKNSYTEVEKKESYSEFERKEVPKEDSLMDGQMLPLEFLDKLDIKLDSDDTYSVLLLGGCALVALWMATAIVGAVDSIPLFPKILEVVGLGYTVWFSTRYLIFKENREELVTKIEEIKQQVLGSSDD